MFDFSRSFKLNEIERNFDFEKLKKLSEQSEIIMIYLKTEKLFQQ